MVKMTFLKTFLGCLSRRRLSRQHSEGHQSSRIQEEPIQRPEEPEDQSLHAGVKICPPSSSTAAKPLLIQVKPQHPQPDEEETLPSLSTVDPLMVQMASPEVEQERPPERRGRRRTKKERKTDSSDATSPPAKPKLAWMDTAAQNTKAEEKPIKKEKEIEDEAPVEMVVEVNLRPERRRKKERTFENATPPPAKPKLAWMETDSTKEDEMGSPERQANKREETKTEQAANVTPPPAKGNETHIGLQEPESSRKSQKTSRWQKGHLFLLELAEKKFTAEKEKKEIRKEKKKIREEEKIRKHAALYEKYANDPSMKHLLINKHGLNKSYCCALCLLF